jgi:hypothetical protein
MERDEQQEQEGHVPDATDQSPEEFRETVESDPSLNPADEDLDRLRGG